MSNPDPKEILALRVLSVLQDRIDADDPPDPTTLRDIFTIIGLDLDYGNGVFCKLSRATTRQETKDVLTLIRDCVNLTENDRTGIDYDAVRRSLDIETEVTP